MFSTKFDLKSEGLVRPSGGVEAGVEELESSCSRPLEVLCSPSTRPLVTVGLVAPACGRSAAPRGAWGLSGVVVVASQELTLCGHVSHSGVSSILVSPI